MIDPSHLFNSSTLSLHLPASPASQLLAPPSSSTNHTTDVENELVDKWVALLSSNPHEREEVYYRELHPTHLLSQYL